MGTKEFTFVTARPECCLDVVRLPASKALTRVSRKFHGDRLIGAQDFLKSARCGEDTRTCDRFGRETVITRVV